MHKRFCLRVAFLSGSLLFQSQNRVTAFLTGHTYGNLLRYLHFECDQSSTRKSLARRGSSNTGPVKMPRGVKKENLPSKICVTCGRPFTWRKKWERVWDEVTTCSKSCNGKRRQANRGEGGAPNSASGGSSDGSVKKAVFDRPEGKQHGSFSEGQQQSRRGIDAVENGKDGYQTPAIPRWDNDDDMSLFVLGGEEQNLAAIFALMEASTTDEIFVNKDSYERTTDDSNIIGTASDIISAASTNAVEPQEGLDPDAIRKIQRKAAQKALKLERRAQREGRGDPEAGKKACDMCAKSVNLLIRCMYEQGQTDWKMICGKCWNVASGGVVDGDADHPHYRYGGLWKNRRAQVG